MNQAFIDAVRADKKVGRGSCSNIDECYEDSELWEMIKEAPDTEGAVKIARECAGLWLEQGLNQRWGEDDDPQLLAYNEFYKED